jgi:hypothetical protein
MKLADLKSQGWQFTLSKPCIACAGKGSVARASFANASLNGGYYGSSSQAEAPCTQCINGFVFAPVSSEDALLMVIEGLIDHLEKPENSALRKQYLDLYITDTELRMTGKAP